MTIHEGGLSTGLGRRTNNLYFLQETYSEANYELLWESEWGGKFFSLMGHAILSKSLEYTSKDFERMAWPCEKKFNLKVQKLQTHLDMWSPRRLTLFEKVLIIKGLGLSQILYSASNINVPKDIAKTVKGKFL